mgnify:CR=1 FL=1
MFFYSLLATALSVPIPGVTIDTSNPVSYLSGIYLYVVGISGVFALLIMVYSGVEYILAAGRPALQESARHRITRTIFGLLLLFSAVLILNVIDPSLKEIKLLNVEPVKKIDIATTIIQPRPPGPIPPYDERRCQLVRDEIALYKAQLSDARTLTDDQKNVIKEKIANIDQAINKYNEQINNNQDSAGFLKVALGLAISQKEELQKSLNIEPVNYPAIREDLRRAEAYLTELRSRGFCQE